MYRFQLYDSEDIQKLKKEIDVYRNLLEAINLEHLYEQLDILKSNNADLVEKIINLKGEIKMMNEKYEQEKREFEKREQTLTKHIDTLDTALMELKEDVNKVMTKIDNLQLKEIVQKVDQLMKVKEKDTQTEKEVEKIKTELKEVKEQLKEKEEQLVEHTSSKRTSEFRRLQNMLQSQNSLHSSNTFQNRRNPARNPSFFHQIRPSQQSIMVSYHNSENMIEHQEKKMSPPLGLNKNIITRIKPSHLKKTTLTKNIESTNEDETKKENEALNENIQEKRIESKEVKKEENITNDIQREEISIEKLEVNLENKVSSENEQIENKIEENNINEMTIEQTEKMKDQPEEKEEKLSIFSFFRKS